MFSMYFGIYIFSLWASVASSASTLELEYVARACSVYCSGPVLDAVQSLHLYNDSKTFVDMPMLEDPEVVLDAFASVNASDRAAVQAFVNTYFAPAGSDVADWAPTDLKSDPEFLKHVPTEYKAWAAELNALWGILGRQTTAEVAATPQRHSFVPRSWPMIVPGGRFRESYYWDSWWIVRGLLVCDMKDSARYVISNLLDDMENFGFVPNGGRIYYLDRSQPPLLSEMVLSYLDKVGMDAGLDLLQRAFPLLEREYQWWMNETLGHAVSLPDGYVLNRFASLEASPRPESYREDVETAKRLEEESPLASTSALYRSLRAGAETGWDFSSRWISGSDKSDLAHIETSTVVPVELNSYMYRMERNLARFGALLNASADTVSFYYAAADRRFEAVERVLWNAGALSGQGLWCDYNLTSRTWNQVDAASLSISQWIPMWAGLGKSKNGVTLAQELYRSGLLGPGGVTTTKVRGSGQQWDAPNAWAPLVLLAVEGLVQTQQPAAIYLAGNISQVWLNSNYLAYNKTGYMYEKYNADQVGVGGGGGEYVPQVGFGWTNGVALVLLNTSFAFVVPDDDSGTSSNHDGAWFLVVLLLSISAAVVISALSVLLVARIMKKVSPQRYRRVFYFVNYVTCGLWGPSKHGSSASKQGANKRRGGNAVAGGQYSEEEGVLHSFSGGSGAYRANDAHIAFLAVSPTASAPNAIAAAGGGAGRHSMSPSPMDRFSLVGGGGGGNSLGDSLLSPSERESGAVSERGSEGDVYF